MAAVEQVIDHALESSPHPELTAIQSYILKTPGKRLRPALCLLTFKALAQNKPAKGNVIHTASALELIHMASLLHDDVIDEAPVRHNLPSVVAKWGSGVAITTGVLLYSMALGLICSQDDLPAMAVISHAVKVLCHGELQQILERGNTSLSLNLYLEILAQKTGVLFAAACQCGALAAAASGEQLEGAKRYGQKLGLVFQILDDYMDLVGDEKNLKKEPGQDFRQGELTLPVLLHLETCSDSERQEVLALFELRKDQDLQRLLQLLKHSNSLQKTKDLAFKYLDEAVEGLNSFPDSVHKTALLKIATYVKDRV